MAPTICSNSDSLETRREWFAFRVRPRHEKSVALQLQGRNEECFVPLVVKKRKWARRIVEVHLPLISGYVFCHTILFGMLAILKTPGIVDVIRLGNSPVPIPDAEISALERAVKSGAQIEPCPHVEIGEIVEIQSGPLAGIVGIVNDRKKGNSVILSISLLRRSVLVQVDLAHLATRDAGAEMESRSNRLTNCA
jgi:transcription antitermination factor NusG